MGHTQFVWRASARRWLAVATGVLLAMSTVAAFSMTADEKPTSLSVGGNARGNSDDRPDGVGRSEGDDDRHDGTGRADDHDDNSRDDDDNDDRHDHDDNSRDDDDNDDRHDHGGDGSTTSTTRKPRTTTTTSRSGTTTTTNPKPESGVDAVAYQLNAAHTGGHEDPALPDDLDQLWSRQLGGKVSYPLIVGDTVFVTVAHATSYGTALYALDRETGASVWGPIDLGGTYNISGLAYGSGAVYTVNFDGVLTAFEADDGDIRWAKDLPGQYAFTSPPTARGGVVYVGGAGSGGTLYAVDTDDGDVLWTASVANGDHSSPAVSHDAVYVDYACNLAYRFDLTGALVWRTSPGCSGGGGKTTVLYGSTLFVRDSGTALALDADDGSLRYGFSYGPAPAFRAGSGFFVSNGGLEARDPDNNAFLWRYNATNVVSAPIVVGDSVFVGDSSGEVRRFDVSTGEQLWHGAAGAPIEHPDEHNAWILTGMAEGRGVLAVAAGSRLTVFG